MLKYLSHITIIREIVMKRTTKNLICAASLIAIASIAACGPKTSQEMETAEVTEPVTAAVDESWKNGRNLTGYDVSDKNGARTLWVEFGEESADIYDDKGQIFGSVNYGQLKDTEYSKQGFAFADIDNDGYLDASMPGIKNEFGNYTYNWIYNFVDRKFMDRTAELTNEKEVLWLIANGILGNNSSRQITQMFNNSDVGVVNGVVTLDNRNCKAYSISDDGRETARLYYDQNGDWYIDEGCKNIYSIMAVKNDSYVLDGVLTTPRARSIAGYTLADFYGDASAVSTGISQLWVAAGDASVSADSISSAINSVVSAYEIVIDDKGTIRRMSRGGTNVFEMAAGQFGIDLSKYEKLK